MEPTKILIVDDEPDLEHLIRQKFRRNVRDGELHLLFAPNGVEALTQLRNDSEIAVLLTDINMPEMDGLALLSQLPDLDQSVTPVVISAYGDMENIRMAMNLGSFDFLTKPIDLNDLEITVHKAIETMQSRQQAEQARETFGRYVSDEVVNELLSSPEALELGGEIRTVTLLMVDIRGFTAATQGLEPHKIVDVLNIYLGEMVEIVSAFGGTIDNFIGDGILVVFGAPISMGDDCFRAAACAIAMQLGMEEVNRRIASLAVRSVSMGIGVHTGEVIVGNIGSARRMKYSVVGSGVNLASRVESSTVGGQILITEATKSELGDQVETGKSFSIKVKGIADPVVVHELTGCGDPYNLRLTVDNNELYRMPDPVTVEIGILDGKSLSENRIKADLTKVSASGAEFAVDRPISVLTDIKIIGSGAEDMSDSLYAKVTGTNDADKLIEVRFTGLSPLAAERVEGWLTQSSGSTT